MRFAAVAPSAADIPSKKYQTPSLPKSISSLSVDCAFVVANVVLILL
jgi:hypothetical protein